MGQYGYDLTGHRSHQVTADLVGWADLVLGMSRRHVQEAVLLESASWRRAFTVKEAVRRGELVGPRPEGAALRSWVAAVQSGRTRADLAGRDAADEVADPFGGPAEGYRRTADELADLVRRLDALLRPGRPGERPPPAPVPDLEDPNSLS
jgi:protein-tyrosine-phosphatase